MKAAKKNYSQKSSGIFIPTRNGEFVEYKGEVGNGSINEVTQCLGYHPDQVYTYLGDFNRSFSVDCVVLEIFTENVVYVSTKKNLTKLDIRKVNYFMRNFKFQEEFDSIKVRGILEDGINNKSLTIDYLAKVLNISDPGPDGLFFISSLDLHLEFSNGYLVGFQSANGLDGWSNYFKSINPALLEDYENEAKRYWGNNIKEILNEINVQAEAMASTPDLFRNEFLELHRNANGIVNYRMLLVCHYNYPISLKEFLMINHGRYVEVPQDLDTCDLYTTLYRLGFFVYEFKEDEHSSDGTLVKISPY